MIHVGDCREILPTLPARSVHGLHWRLSHRADPEVVPLADRHYNRQKIGSPQFAPPGRCLVLKTQYVDAFWITSWPYAQYVKHAWAGAWVCSAFRNESHVLSSELIQQAVSCTLWRWPDPPDLGMVTFVDPRKVRRKRDFGRCYRKAGFEEVGATKGGLVALQLKPMQMPLALPWADYEWEAAAASERTVAGPSSNCKTVW